jgi:prepilin-type processing-associated H-X9-DG protein
VLLDEHPNSINDAAFAFKIPVNPAQTYWVDVPAAWHNNGCNFSFADGHVEYHLWKEPQVIPSVVWEADTVPAIGNELNAVPNDPDVQWLAHRTSALAPGAPPYTYQP